MSGNTNQVLNIAIIWHNHQPQYVDLAVNKSLFPWVRLHATKDYYDMVSVLDDYPKMKLTFNLTPVLLWQLDQYSKKCVTDNFLDLTLKNARDLTEEEQIFVLYNFFMANWDNMVAPYPRYNELLEKRGRNVVIEEIKRTKMYFKEQDYRDLQVWFNLCWFDPYWKRTDELVKRLFGKGKGFTEEEKKCLIEKQLEVCGKIAGKYRELMERKQIEIITSPFYHPILPLLCDTMVAKQSLPEEVQLIVKYRHPEDAAVQVRKAVEYYKSLFGTAPKGMWPSEGSVSEDIIPILAKEGIKWIATDEEILFRSLSQNVPQTRELLYQAYNISIDNNMVNAVFRDHTLSDLIGFAYQKWDPVAAANNFIKRLEEIGGKVLHHSVPPLITVCLDGENCWEHYNEDGEPFLRELYRQLSEHPFLKPTTVSEFLENNSNEKTVLTKLWPGSWINANFGIWIGNREDQLGWEYLAKTRVFLATNEGRIKDENKRKLAWESLYAAEGSDWFWWFGEEFSSGQDETFDFLFRKHLMNIYDIVGEKVPDWLHIAIKGTGDDSETKKQNKLSIPPSNLITPQVDGLVTNYYEWRSAGLCQTARAGGTMHQAESLLQSMYYGFDLQNLYIRFDTLLPLKKVLGQNIVIKVVFLKPEGCHIVIPLSAKVPTAEFYSPAQPDGEKKNLLICMEKIIELVVPLKLLSTVANDKIEYVVVIEKDIIELERWPHQSSVTFNVPDDKYLLGLWSA
ncbi:MAG: glycoside hydrolase family 57 protein [Elusimicrobiota bacterium]